MADFVWRGAAALALFALAGIASRWHLLLAAVGVAALSMLDGLAVVPVWLLVLGALVVWVLRPPWWLVTAAAVLVVVVAVAGALAGWRAADELRSARRELSGLQVADIDDVDGLDASLTAIEDRLGAARDSIDSPWARPARYLPLLGAHLHAAEGVIGATETVFDAAQPLRSLDVSDFAVQGGIDLDLVAATSGDVTELAGAAARAEEVVRDVDRAWLVPWLDDELDEAGQVLGDGADDTARVARLLDGLWRQAGGERPQRWFLVLCSPVEARAACGFPGNYMELVVDGGRFEVVESGRISDIEDRAVQAGLELTVGGDYQARYEQFGVAQTWRNITMAPHWPDVAGAIRQLYRDLTGRTVDVVAGINTEGMSAIMRLTGPVELDELGTVTADNVRQKIEIDQYALFDDQANRIDSLAELTDRVIDALLALDHVDADQLRAAAHSADDGAIVVHANDDPELLFAEAGVDGALPGRPIGVTWQNAAANKLDAYIRTRLTYAVPGPGGGCVEFRLRNEATRGLPEYVRGRGVVVPPGWQRSWISIYAPTEVTEVQVDGEPIDIVREAEHGIPVASLTVDIPIGEAVTIVASLAPGSGQPVDVLLQPASIPTDVTELAAGAGTNACGA